MAGDLMSTHIMELKSDPLPAATRRDRAVDPHYTVSASIRVRAETRRLFQALVVPEYLEAWLWIPEEGASWSITPMQRTEGFVLESFNSKPLRVIAGYTSWRRRRLSIRWRLEKNRLIEESNVLLRLIGDFECSVLSLCHSGLRSFEEYAWHRRLWTESLERLTKLF